MHGSVEWSAIAERGRGEGYGELSADEQRALLSPWFGPDLPKSVLMAAVDDADGSSVGARFVPSESGAAYLLYGPLTGTIGASAADAAFTGASAGGMAGTAVAGSVTTLAFLGALARHEGFAKGEVDTGLIGRDIDALTADGQARQLAEMGQ